MEQLTELKLIIEAQLNECDTILHPQICKMKTTDDGYKTLEENILQRCIARGITVGQAVNEIEKEFNPNLNND